MRKTAWTLAMLAAIAMTVIPAVPVKAAIVGEQVVRGTAVAAADANIRQQIAKHAEQGNAAILSQAQMKSLARTNPKLHAKLMTAYRNHAIPNLTQDERTLMAKMTSRNLEAYKAGSIIYAAPAFPWFVFAFLGIILFLLILNWFGVLGPRPAILR